MANAIKDLRITFERELTDAEAAGLYAAMEVLGLRYDDDWEILYGGKSALVEGAWTIIGLVARKDFTAVLTAVQAFEGSEGS